MLAIPKTRVVRSHVPWVPWQYQERAVEHLCVRTAAALFLDPGLGKTAITLEAFRRLRAEGIVKRMLVVAPLRVCQLVWEQEGRKWSQFRDLTFSLLHGSKKEARLRNDNADITLINPEGVPWLAQQFYGKSNLPWDIVVIDELTKFKNHRAKRSKALRAKLRRVPFRWGLTGSPAPNGYMDLFGQMLILDDGASLGKWITYYRNEYFYQAFNGFTWELRKGAAQRIEARIAPLVLRMSAADYLELPPLVDHIIDVELPPAARKKYEELKEEMLLSLPEGVVTAANSGAVYTKLKQITNGAVYINDEKDFAEIHDAKLEALEELIEELAGQPLLVAYEFQHDLTRLRARLGADTPTLSGLSHKQITEVEAAWNRGELPVLLVHPASAGHGLNLQGDGASHICWFSRPWDLEQYEQTIRRIYRQGTTAARVVNHVLSAKGTIDEIVGEALSGKDTTQQRLLAALNAEILRDQLPRPSSVGNTDTTEEKDMVKKLGFHGGESNSSTATTDAPRRPKGWGPPPDEGDELPAAYDQPQGNESIMQEVSKTPKGWGPPPSEREEDTQQRSAIRSKISAPAPVDEESGEEEEEEPASVKALSAFGNLLESVMDEEEEGEKESNDPLPPLPAETATQDPPKKATRRRGRNEAEPAPAQTRAATLHAAQADVAPNPVASNNLRIHIEVEGLTPDRMRELFLILGNGVRD